MSPYSMAYKVYSSPSTRSAEVPVVCTTLGDTIITSAVISTALSSTMPITVKKVIILVRLAISRETAARLETIILSEGYSISMQLSDFISLSSSGSLVSTGYFFSFSSLASFSLASLNLISLRSGSLFLETALPTLVDFFPKSLLMRYLVFIRLRLPEAVRLVIVEEISSGSEGKSLQMTSTSLLELSVSLSPDSWSFWVVLRAKLISSSEMQRVMRLEVGLGVRLGESSVASVFLKVEMRMSCSSSWLRCSCRSSPFFTEQELFRGSRVNIFRKLSSGTRPLGSPCLNRWCAICSTRACDHSSRFFICLAIPIKLFTPPPIPSTWLPHPLQPLPAPTPLQINSQSTPPYLTSSPPLQTVQISNWGMSGGGVGEMAEWGGAVRQPNFIISRQIFQIMNSLFNNLLQSLRGRVAQPLRRYLATPIGKITLFNSLLFISWKVTGVSESFLVKHFSFEKYSLTSTHIYTSLTYAFSHLSLLHFTIDMLALQFIGKHIQSKYGSRYVWGLYLAGALAGSLSMNYFMPYDTIPVPKVGADPCISAFLSFMAVQNPTLTLFQFVLPFKFWMLIAAAAAFFVFTDSSCKNLGGLTMGLGLGLLRRRFLL